MLSLVELERWFASITKAREVPDDTAARLVTAGPKLTASERIKIYQDGYFARLTECLADDYPALAYALGEMAFEGLCSGYIAAHPSRSTSLNYYGSKMADHCRTRTEPWAAFACDLARLEWALVEIVHEPRGDALPPHALSHLTPDDLARARLVPNPALRVLLCDYPVNAYYRSFREELAPALPEAAASGVAVYRSGLTLWRVDLEPRAAALLADLVSGMSLERALIAAAARAGASEAVVALAQALPRWLESWMRDGFFQHIELAT
jgi:hypothetical protein